MYTIRSKHEPLAFKTQRKGEGRLAPHELDSGGSARLGDHNAAPATTPRPAPTARLSPPTHHTLAHARRRVQLGARHQGSAAQ
ncbi:hypothetical protein E2C01_052228 [Portunus trituberculatus]|uniref:Uncharacterized protein n=1 Tax=Portunus trituberculatus TaxID=210409 RepID=A0A5B7GH00_PORTR|nr:hypothetical protein [Portunus trituberculatus]